jgi:hypothetical protein
MLNALVCIVVGKYVMSPIFVLDASNLASKPLPLKGGSSNNKPISLLAFLQAENQKLHNIIAKLEHDTKVLRLALGK